MFDSESAWSGYDPPPSLRKTPSWLVNELAKRARSLVAEGLEAEGVRRQHFTVLASLAEQGPASQADLGRRLWIDRSDLHTILRQLEAGGLVARERDSRDGRRNVVSITAAGTGALERLRQRVEEAQSALLSPLSTAERQDFQRLLEALVEPAPAPGARASARRRSP